MKTTTALAFFILISFYSFSQRTKPNKMSLVPKGTFVVKEDTTSRKISIDAFWMSEEITNKEYREFIMSLKNNPKDSIGIIDYKKLKDVKNKNAALKTHSYQEILQNVIDTSVWNSDKNFKNYFNDKKFDNYPVVGVTFMNAVFYCYWRTKTENELRNDKGLPFTMNYRLPQEIEWEYAATNSIAPLETEIYKVIKKVNSGNKSDFDLHNHNDNVSEWTASTAENGDKIIKGSSWKTYRKLSDRVSAKPSFRDNSTGFRIVKSYVGKK